MKQTYALVGMRHRNTEALVKSLPDQEPVTLVREPDNPYDSNAVQVWARGTHVGYISAKQVRPLALAMDSVNVPAPNTYGVFCRRSSADKWPLVEVDL